MTQITIRRLDPTAIEGLRKRTAGAGHSMEEEVRKILSEAVLGDQLERQRAWLAHMETVRRRLFGAKIFPDSTPLIRRMRGGRTRQIKKWALPNRKGK
jgi:plasmid stability protein